MSARKLKSLVASCALLFAGAACADVPLPLDRVSLSLGAFYPTVDARVQASSSDIAGTNVNFQRDLGLGKQQTLPNFRLDFLVFDSQGFSISGYQYSRHASTTLARDIQFDGNDYDTSAFVEARLRLQTINGSWHWWFAPTATDVLGIGLGAAYYDLKGTLDGSITVNGGTASARGEAEGSAVAPLLTLGWRHAFSDRLRAYADFSGVRKPSGALTGHLLNGNVGVEYYPWQNAGFALEYNANNLDLKADKESWVGRARIHFYGPAAFVRLRF
jgi:hypothetical protein